ncbi:hypothetical protein VTN31DRAFT_1288 [Thermomyces dupontii]|uniref:uncharacterized protein n=1 Tax=Talaromyces thermophilus TaxID=28565 RepID=UPI0037443D6E
MCYYKPNRPPCLCNTHYLAYPCHRAQFLPSQNPRNPSPFVKVCGLITVLPEIRPRACFQCEALFAEFVRQKRKNQDSVGAILNQGNSSTTTAARSSATKQTETKQQVEGESSSADDVLRKRTQQQQQQRRPRQSRQRPQSQAQKPRSRMGQETEYTPEKKQASHDPARSDGQTKTFEGQEQQRIEKSTGISSIGLNGQSPVRASPPSSPHPLAASTTNDQENVQHHRSNNDVRVENAPSPVRDEVQPALQKEQQQEQQQQQQRIDLSVSDQSRFMPADSISSGFLAPPAVNPYDVVGSDASVCPAPSAATVRQENPRQGNEFNWILTDTSDAAADLAAMQLTFSSENVHLPETLEDYIGITRHDSDDARSEVV